MNWLRKSLGTAHRAVGSPLRVLLPSAPQPAPPPLPAAPPPPPRRGPTGRSAAEIDRLRAELTRLGPWYSYYDFGDDVEAVSPWPQVNREHFRDRADRLFAALGKHVRPEECTLLDIGCADGYFAIDAAQRGYKRVVGIDFRQDSIDRAQFAARTLDVANVDFRTGNVYEPGDLGDASYDVVICQGLFYHLSDPVRALRNVRARTGKVAFMAGWTVIRKDAVFYVRTEDTEDIRNGDRSIIMVPTAAGIRKVLELVGYSSIVDVNPWTSEPDWTSDQGDWREYLAFS